VSIEIRNDQEHPSRHALTRYHAGELEGTEREKIDSHIGDCPECSRLLAELSRTKEEFEASHDRKAFLAKVTARAGESDGREQSRPDPWWRWLLRPAALAPLAASIILLILAISLLPSNESGERTKGKEIELGFYLLQGDTPRVASENERLHPKDRIQFRLTAPAGGYVHIVGIDEAGMVSVYFPRPGDAPEAFPGGAGRPVPGSVILDDTLGRERVFVLICDRPMGRARLDRQLKKFRDGPRALLDAEELPIDCSQSSLLLTKERP
jgi:hypothetical protein